ncbi:MAG: 3-dehydroquinate synthase [Rhodospirillales bacterium]
MTETIAIADEPETGPDKPQRGAADGGLTRLALDLGARSYDILVGENLLARAGDLIRPALRHPRVIIITDTHVADAYLGTVEAAFRQSGIESTSLVLPAGEQTKTFGRLMDLCERILDQRIERSTTLVALGGGVIGDIAGFAAAVTLRGLDFVQIPTSLLAQVDSSVGGKTGINTRHGKNLIGAFHQPLLVLADTGVLDSLPEREFNAGYAEVVKYGLINDPAFFDWLERNGPAFAAGDGAARAYAVTTSCRAKAAIVAADEHEKGQRALLNLGHTFGHALEAETGYGATLLHGEAVGIGMVMAFDLSVRMGLCPAGDANRVRRHLSAMGLRTDLTGLAGPDWSAEALVDHMTLDKKVSGGRMTFILTRGIGRSFITQDVDQAVLTEFLADAVARAQN